eukprot:c5794_g1_i3.p1 GENE.c5794_g1_i3~~c5794_g1_i3.p1  ORF type:complete len:172 (+),score=30.53 c5794_g1_i3:355-870(+)
MELCDKQRNKQTNKARTRMTLYFAHNHKDNKHHGQIAQLSELCGRGLGVNVHHVEDLLRPAEMNYVLDLVSSGIEKCDLVVLFLTQSYVEAVNQTNNEGDLCKLEFGYISRRHQPSTIVPVVLDRNLLNTASWNGPIGKVSFLNLVLHFLHFSTFPEICLLFAVTWKSALH